jgi:hypothetical protein
MTIQSPTPAPVQLYEYIAPQVTAPAAVDADKHGAVVLNAGFSSVVLPLDGLTGVEPGHIYRCRPCWEGQSGYTTQVGILRAFDQAGVALGEQTTFTEADCIFDPITPVAGVPEVWFEYRDADTQPVFRIGRTDSSASTFRFWLMGVWVDEPPQPSLPAGIVGPAALELGGSATFGEPDLREALSWRLSGSSAWLELPLAGRLAGAGSYRFRPAVRLPSTWSSTVATMALHDGASVLKTTHVYGQRQPPYQYTTPTDWSAYSEGPSYWPVMEWLWDGIQDVSQYRLRVERYPSALPWLRVAGLWVERCDRELYDAAVHNAPFEGYNYTAGQWDGQVRTLPPPTNFTLICAAELNITARLTALGDGAGTYRITPWIITNDQSEPDAERVMLARIDVHDVAHGDQTLLPLPVPHVRASGLPLEWPDKAGAASVCSFTFTWDGSMSVQVRVLRPPPDWAGATLGGNYGSLTWLIDNVHTVSVRGCWIEKVEG